MQASTRIESVSGEVKGNKVEVTMTVVYIHPLFDDVEFCLSFETNLKGGGVKLTEWSCDALNQKVDHLFKVKSQDELALAATALLDEKLCA